VLQLGQLDLQLALVALRPQGKDVEDQRRTVDHAAIELALEVALLRGRDVVIEDDDVGLVQLATTRFHRPCPCRQNAGSGAWRLA
jgi:hypothetical protein